MKQYGDWLCTSKSSDTAIIDGYVGESLDLVIPESINGKRIIGISSRAFRPESHPKQRVLYRSIRSVKIPELFGNIEYSAFENCRSLQFVILPNNLK